MDERTHFGPYRATTLWNDVIRTFRTGVPVGRHRRYMKTYDDCFIASSSVDWLHTHLRNNVNFGPSVTRTQTVQLMQKFHKSRVFEDVRETKYDREEFTDTGRLFRIIYSSPSPVKTGRAPLVSRTNLNQTCLTASKRDNIKPDATKSLMSTSCCLTKELTPSETCDIWKTVVLRRLQALLGLTQLSDIVDESLLSGAHIVHNCNYVNKNGVVTNIGSADQLPYWALSAMRCLAHWPERVDDHLPVYPGFEKDVFRVVKDYFEGLGEPLVTYNMYEVITNVFVAARQRGLKQTRNFSTTAEFAVPGAMSSFESVENLMMDLTMNNALGQSPRSELDGESYDSSQSCGLNTNIDCLENGGLLDENTAETRLETAFGGSNDNNNEDEACTTRRFMDRHDDNRPSRTTSLASRRISPSYLANKREMDRLHVWSFVADDNCTLPRDRRLNRTQGYGYSVALVSREREAAMSHKRNCSYENPSYINDENVEERAPHTCRAPPIPVVSHPPPRYMPSPPRSDAQSRCTTTRKSAFIQNADVTRPGPRTSHLSRSTTQLNAPAMKPRQTMNVSNNGGTQHSAPPPPYIQPPAYNRRYAKNARPPDTSLHVSRIYCGDVTHVVTHGQRRVDDRRRRSVSHSDLTAESVTAFDETQRRLSKTQYLSTPELSDEDHTTRMCETLQLALLLLPPANRRKLHLLLRLMYKMCHNVYLHLTSTPIRTLVLESFYRSIISPHDPADMDELVAIQLVTFLVDHYAEVLVVPEKVVSEVESELARVSIQSTDRPCPDNINKMFDADATVFCEQISVTEYEMNKTSHAELGQLLDVMVQSNRLTSKEKRKKLTEFARSHPEVYRKRFPTSASLDQLFPKKQALLSRPLRKLRNIRL